MKRLFVLLIMLVLLPCSAVLGQITVSSNDYYPSPGSMLIVPMDIFPDAQFFNSLMDGSGGPMIWDFSSRSFGGPTTYTSVGPASTPQIGNFPDANLVLQSPIGPTDTAWQVYQSTASSFTTLGIVSHVISNETVLKYEDYTTEWTFPFSYNDQWISYRHTMTPSANSYNRTFDTTSYVVDAWGTAKYMTREVACLRVITEQRVTTNTYDLQDQLIGSTTVVSTTVNFIGAGFHRLVGATRVSFAGFDNYVTSASNDFVGAPTAVYQLDDSYVPANFTLAPNYPNPFNPSTEIRFSLPAHSHVRLTVYDLLGREVARLVDQDMPAGVFIAEWDGRNTTGESAATGVYFYRLSAGEQSETRKMLLLK